MLGFFKSILQGLWPEESEPEENEADILYQIQQHGDLKVVRQNTVLPDSAVVSSDEIYKCLQKRGTITCYNDDYGIIDGQHYFDSKVISPGLQIKENDEVTYLMYKAKDNETHRVHKIYSLANETWEETESNGEEEIGLAKLGADEKEIGEDDVKAFTRKITVQVIKRNGRELHFNFSKLTCSLDKVHSSFVPVEGDWALLGVVVSVDEDVDDFAGEVLEVLTIDPLRSQVVHGRVTLWSDLEQQGDGEGVIDRKIYFNRSTCESGYIPNLNDEVYVEAVESHQGRLQWRALSVASAGKSGSLSKPGLQPASTTQLSELYRDKQHVSLFGHTNFEDLHLNETKELILEIKNFGNRNQLLLRGKFHSERSTSQMRMLSPAVTNPVVLRPNTSLRCVFECTGKYVGASTELFVFAFKSFKIGRDFNVNVLMSKSEEKLLPCESRKVFKRSANHVEGRITNRSDSKRLYGPSLSARPHFAKGEKPGVFKVPQKLWDVVLGDGTAPRRWKDVEQDLLELVPHLADDLTSTNYSDRFHTLLYLEEIAVRKSLRQFDMNRVTLRHRGEFLALEVPGLMERRPSLILGDKVVVTQPWLAEAGEVEHVGTVHETRAKELLIRFHPSFHETYAESDCNVWFESNMAVLKRSHDAVNRAIRNLGLKWLFPSGVTEKPEQVNLETIEDPRAEFPSTVSSLPMEEFDVDERGFLHPKPRTSAEVFAAKTRKTLRWVNRSLNPLQQAAVVNILRGVCRPLPYIVFGPPGTGKTVTLIEAVLQLVKLVPDSRLLIATPSNSSADLVCTLLINSGLLQPGDLLRVVAAHRMREGKVPEHLIPFCSTAAQDGRGVKDPPAWFRQSTVGLHRITVGTCVSLGELHYTGYPRGHFTHILLDETGQATEPELLIPISFLEPSAGQVVFTGDPEQLGPVTICNMAGKWGLEDSLLLRLSRRFPYAKDKVGFPDMAGYDPRCITRLTMNYRSVPEILSLPSQLFYNAELVATVSQSEGREADTIRALALPAARHQPPALLFHGVRGSNYQEEESPSWFNPQEAWEAVRYLRQCYAAGLTEDDVGVVTPYLMQAKKIRGLLTELDMPVPKVGTVEDFQGQERLVVIVSAVRSSAHCLPSDLGHSIGFIASPRRLNVALTRARAVLVVLGNPHLLTVDPYWRSVVAYCVALQTYIGCDLPHGMDLRLQSLARSEDEEDTTQPEAAP